MAAPAPDPANHPKWDPCLPVARAAEYVGVHVETLRELVRSREIAAVRLNGRLSNIRIRLSVLNKWISRHEIPASRLA